MTPFPNSPTGTTGLQKSFGIATRGVFRDALLDIYQYLDQNKKIVRENLVMKSSLDAGSINYINNVLEKIKLDLSPIVKTYIAASWMKGNENVAKMTNLGGWIPFDLRVLKALQDNAFFFLNKYISEKQDELREILLEGISQGDTIHSMANEIKNSFKMTSWKSEQVARAEVIRTHGKATETAIRNGGVTKKYEWLTSKRENVCKICLPLHGRIFDIDDVTAPKPIENTHPNCFISNQTPILTIEGYKPIRKMQIGDLVLTKEGKYRKVTKLFFDKFYKGEMVSLYWNGWSKKSSNLDCITVTPEHPIMTKNGYKKAIDLSLDDEIVVTAKKCKGCEKLKNHNEEYEFTTIKLEKISLWKLKTRRRLYNFEVDEFHNYIAKGIVVKNCNCGIVPSVTF